MFNIFSRKPSAPQKLFYTTDIHCHVVPGIDDGSPSPERSVELIGRMRKWGINRIIATPHVTESTFENTPEIMDSALEQLQASLAKADPEVSRGLQISHSAEYRLDDFFKSNFENNTLAPFPNGYLLVENSFIQEPWGLDKTLFEIKIKGFRPILAHPERYTYYHGHRDRYVKLHNDGTLFQVNLLSLAGHYGKEQRKVAEWMMEQGMVDFLGSDLHNHNHADAIEAYLASKDYQRDLKMLTSTVKNDLVF